MRGFQIRKAKIGPELRATFEQHGVATMQTLLAAPDRPFVHAGQIATADSVRDDLLHWLTEQYDRAERKETWLITMEAGIVVLVAIEVLSLFGLVHTSCVPR